MRSNNRRPWAYAAVAAGLIAACTQHNSSEPTTSDGQDTGLEDDTASPPPYGVVAFPCNPRQGDNCPQRYTCCSTDPSARGGQRPDFEAMDVASGMPYFAGVNNDISSRGICVHVPSVRPELTLNGADVVSCPIPCNPTWEVAEVEATCGTGVECCQTVLLEPTDCIQDDPHDPQSWRPVRGADILEGRTDWGHGRHGTHQDPTGSGCAQFVDEASLDNPEFAACIERLTVANQRGYCGRIDHGCGQDVELDACEQINMGLIPPP